MSTIVKPVRVFPYSYSSLTSFEMCARKHFGERISKEFARPFNAAADKGDSIHKQAELYALHGTDFDNQYKKQIKEIVDELKSQGGEFFAERELCVTVDKLPTGWWDTNGHARAKIDLLHIAGDQAVIIDWKTGKPDPYSTQLKQNALLVFIHYPEVNTVHTRYEWLAKGYATKAKVHREFFDADWEKFEARAAKFAKAAEKNLWTAKPNFLCGKYCGVTSCENHGKTFR
jgi:ATP-dependent exoDNAse (exonuclease V) beta subunit